MSESQGVVYVVDGEAARKSTVKQIRTGLIIGAVLALVAAIVIFSWPKATLAVIAVVFGIYILVRGVSRLAFGIFGPGLTGLGRTLSIILGVLLIAAAIFVFANLVTGLAILGILIGLSWILDGIATLVESHKRALPIVIGIISIVAGVVVLFIPVSALAALVWLFAIFLIVVAIFSVIGAITVGRAAK